VVDATHLRNRKESARIGIYLIGFQLDDAVCSKLQDVTPLVIRVILRGKRRRCPEFVTEKPDEIEHEPTVLLDIFGDDRQPGGTVEDNPITGSVLAEMILDIVAGKWGIEPLTEPSVVSSRLERVGIVVFDCLTAARMDRRIAEILVVEIEIEATKRSV
jgi:hypothetical protein